MKTHMDITGGNNPLTPEEYKELNANSLKKGAAHGGVANHDKARLPPFRIYPTYEEDPYFVPGLANPNIIAKRKDGRRPKLDIKFPTGSMGLL